MLDFPLTIVTIIYSVSIMCNTHTLLECAMHEKKRWLQPILN